MGPAAAFALVALLLLGLSLAPAGAVPPPGSSCGVFPSNNVWHADISKLPVNARSAQWLASMNASTTRLHPDFGPSGTSTPYGIPYIVVPGSHPKVTVAFEYADESDPGPYPFGSDTPIEGGSGSTGDRHAIMIDKDRCTLYELYDAHYSPSGSTAGSGAIWSLTSNALRPAGWTSADAAGLPIFAGLVRLDEVQVGVVDHAIRVTAARTDRSYLWPARHEAGAANDPTLPPMGARFRLKTSFDISRFRPDTQVILRAMKTYGLIVADNGSNWYFQGAAENGWNTDMLDELKTVSASNFEAVDESSLMVDPNSAAVKTASPKATTQTHPKAPATQVTTVSTAIPRASIPATTSAIPDATSTPRIPRDHEIVAVGTPLTASSPAGLWNVAGLVIAALCVGAAGFLVFRRRGARRL